MNLIVNGRPRETRADDLEDILTELGFAETRVATAVNGTFVSHSSRAATRLREGDRLEILTPRQGG